jgi:uncharacterized protein (TIGR02996 family)
VNDRDALLAAILAQPDEDTPRLALADYLDEHGEAKYATFVRKQIELANVPEWDPLWIRTWNNDRDTITGNGRGKFRPRLTAGLQWPALNSYRRGFLWHVESRGTERFLKHADKLAARVPLQALTLNMADYWPHPLDLTALFASSHLARLKHLGFSLAHLTAATVRQMQACPHLHDLTSLTLAFAHFGPGALRAVFQSPLIRQLETLRLEDCQIDWRALGQSLVGAGGPHRLRRFVVSHYAAGQPVSPRAFDAPLLRGLQELEISACPMDERTVRALCKSRVVNGLESLTLNKTIPGVRGIEALSQCAAQGSLKRLSLRLNKLGAVAVKHLARSPHLAGLEVLDLEANPVGDKGALALAEAPFLPNLAGLNLMHCDIGDTGAEAIMNALSADKVVDLKLYSVSNKASISAGMKRKLRKKFGDRVFA